MRACRKPSAAALHSDFLGIFDIDFCSGQRLGRLGETSISKSGDHRSLYRSDEEDKSRHRTALEGDRGGNDDFGLFFLRKTCLLLIEGDRQSLMLMLSSSIICNDKDETMEESVVFVDVRRMDGTCIVMLLLSSSVQLLCVQSIVCKKRSFRNGIVLILLCDGSMGEMGVEIWAKEIS